MQLCTFLGKLRNGGHRNAFGGARAVLFGHKNLRPRFLCWLASNSLYFPARRQVSDGAVQVWYAFPFDDAPEAPGRRRHSYCGSFPLKKKDTHERENMHT